MKICEKCGQQVPGQIAGLTVDMDRGEVRFREHSVAFTGSQLRLVEALAGKPGRCLTKENLMFAIYWDARGKDWPDIKIIDVFVCKARKELVKIGLLIKTHWGRGYELVVPGLATLEGPSSDPMIGEIRAAVA